MTTAAETFARHRHAGQTDKQGRDYATGHLTPVATMARLLAEGIAWDDQNLADHCASLAWCHDVIEDTGATDFDLVKAGLGSLIADVRILTKRDGETYVDYIDRLLGSATLAVLIVKLADNLVNSSTLDQLDAATRDRLAAKYTPVRHVLLAALGLTVDSHTVRPPLLPPLG